jgi:hypothetical protein
MCCSYAELMEDRCNKIPWCKEILGVVVVWWSKDCIGLREIKVYEGGLSPALKTLGE